MADTTRPKQTPIYYSNTATLFRIRRSPSMPCSLIHNFHKSLPAYSPTPLHSFPHLASYKGVGEVYLKDESFRFGLPSFKILGASWGVFRALTQRFGLSQELDLTDLKVVLDGEGKPTRLFAATDGNHGRAVARMGKILGIKVNIYVPKGMQKSTVKLIKEEGAEVKMVDGDYDEAVRIAFRTSEEVSGILVQDTGFEGYEEIPSWIVEGYSTMLHEIDEQLGDQKADLIIVPVGVGSFAQAVVSHYKSSTQSHRTKVLAVEPASAACLYHSLMKGEPVTITTSSTIMAGLDCGTVSSIAWPLLKRGIDASLTISDYAAHAACVELGEMAVASGPCGAASLAALRSLSNVDRLELGLDKDAVVVLLSTEGPREYQEPENNDPGYRFA